MSVTYIQIDNGLKLALHHYPALHTHDSHARHSQGSVLYIHGATFPANLSVGFKFDGWSWADDLCKAGFDVWALDFIGFGESDRYQILKGDAIPGRCPEAVKQVESAVKEVVSQTGCTRVSLIAHSWGTLAAGAFAASHPNLVDRLVLFGPIAKRQNTEMVTPMPAFRRITVQSQYDRFVSDVPKDEPEVLSKEHFEIWSTAYLASDRRSGEFQPPAVTVPSGPAADIQDAWHGRFPYDPSQIYCPVLVVRGEWDSLIPNKDATWLLKSMTSSVEKQDIKLPKATHLVHLEKGRFDLYKATRDFLRREADTVVARTSGPIAVIFEVEPADGHKSEYLDIAAEIRPLLDHIDGFISVERFQSLNNPKKILSLSFFKDEEAIRQWRTLSTHRQAQGKARSKVFADYHLRIAQVIRDYGMFDRDQAPDDNKSNHRL